MPYIFLFVTSSFLITALHSQSASSPCGSNSCFGYQQTCVEVTTDTSSTVADGFYRESPTQNTLNKRVQPKCVPVNPSGDYCGPENGNGGPYIQVRKSLPKNILHALIFSSLTRVFQFFDIQHNTRNFPCQPNEKCIVTRRCGTQPQGFNSCYPSVTCLRSDSIASPIGGGVGAATNNLVDPRGSAAQCGDAVICPAGQQCVQLLTSPSLYRCSEASDGGNPYFNNNNNNNNFDTTNEVGSGSTIPCGPTLDCRSGQMCVTLKTYPPRYRCLGGGRSSSGSSNYSTLPQLYSDDDNAISRSSLRQQTATPTKCAQLQCAVNRPGTLCIKTQQQSASASLPLTAQCVPQVNDSQDYCQPRFVS